MVLRPLSLKDAPRFCKWLNDSEVTKFLNIYGQKSPTINEERKWIQKSKKDPGKICFSIDTVDGTHIGSISLSNMTGINKDAEYGIFIGNKKYWGQGFGTEAGRLIIDYGFRKLKLHSIYLWFVAYNIRGQKSYDNLGFKKAGVLRENVYRNKCYHDAILMDILIDEYLPAGRQGLKNKKKKI